MNLLEYPSARRSSLYPRVRSTLLANQRAHMSPLWISLSREQARAAVLKPRGGGEGAGVEGGGEP